MIWDYNVFVFVSFDDVVFGLDMSVIVGFNYCEDDFVRDGIEFMN